MSKINDLSIDAPIYDADYDFIMREQQLLDAIDIEDMMVGQEEEEKFEGDTLSYSPEEYDFDKDDRDYHENKEI
jgi:hypothetical protein